jgi:hypothetical protein
VLGFVQREGKRRGGDTWWELVAGEEADEGLSTCRRAAAAAVVGSSHGGARRVKERMRPTSVAECGVVWPRGSAPARAFSWAVQFFHYFFFLFFLFVTASVFVYMSLIFLL